MKDIEREQKDVEMSSRRKILGLGCIGLGAVGFALPGLAKNAFADSPDDSKGVDVKSTIDAREFGVKADGKTDDFKALQHIFNTVLTSVGGIIQLPPGIIVCSARIVNRGKPVMLLGAGRGSTRIHFTGESEDTVGLLFEQQKYPNTLQVRNLSLTTDQQEKGDALTIVYAPEDCCSMRVVERVYLENITIVGEDIANHGFRNGVVMQDTNSPLLYNVCVSGRQPAAGMENRTRTRSCFKFVTGAHGSATPVQAALIKCSGYNAKFGVDMVGAHEGLVINSGNFVECGVGISQNSGPEQGIFEQVQPLPEGGLRPGIWIQDTHCNVFKAGVFLQRVTQGFIQNCLIYKAPDSSQDCVGVRLSRCTDVKINGSMFLNHSPHGLFEGVLAENSTVRCYISDNIFERCDNSVHLSQGTAGCFAWDNLTQGGRSGTLLNEGERNKYRQLGEDVWRDQDNQTSSEQ